MSSESILAGLSLEATLQEVSMALGDIAAALTLAKDPASGRLRVVQDSTVGAVATPVTLASTAVSTVTTMNNLGGTAGALPYAVPAQVPAWAAMIAPADAIRSRIVIT